MTGVAWALAGCVQTASEESEDASPTSGSPAHTPFSNASPLSSSAHSLPAVSLDHRSPDSLAVLVNKLHPLEPRDWIPADLTTVGTVQVRAEVATAVQQMLDDATNAGVALTTLSGFRSYETQVETYNNWVATYGQEKADVASARPGHSEHQTGLALDFGAASSCDLQVCFADTPQANWLAANAYRYGFVLRFPYRQHEVTGYWFESWHYRFVGASEALRYHNSGAQNLESFWGFEAAPDYKN